MSNLSLKEVRHCCSGLHSLVAMAMSVLDNIPDHIKLPENLQLNESSIDNDCLGKLSKQSYELHFMKQNLAAAK